MYALQAHITFAKIMNSFRIQTKKMVVYMVHQTNKLFSLSVDRILVWIITYPFANRFIFCFITNPFKFGCIFMSKYNTTLMHLGKICNANHNIDVNRY